MAQALVCPEVAVDDVCLGLPSNRGHDAHGNIARDSHYVEVSCSDYKDVVDDSRAVDKDDVDDAPMLSATIGQSTPATCTRKQTTT